MKNLLKYFNDLTIHPKNAAELKGLILQLAVQGKLTTKWRVENSNVEPASVLLERIKAEKARLVKNKEIKKEKVLPEIEEEEISFDIPGSWTWSRLGGYIHNFGQKKPDKKFEYIDVASIDNKKGLIQNNLNVLSENEAPSRARKIVKKGCVIYSTVRPYLLNIAVVDRDFKYEAIASTAFAVLNPLLDCSDMYLYHVLRSYFFVEYVERSMKGVAYPAINDANLLQAVIPIPPLEEQKALVSVVNQLFAEVEQLEEQTKQRIQLKEDFATSVLRQLTTGNTQNEWAYLKPHFATFFTEQPNIKKLRESILQLAVQGKLSTHWRNRHPELVSGSNSAKALLERIKAEKAQLIKDKKIKKEKPLPAITEDEIPYELPEGWVWCRMQDLVSLLGDGIHGTPEYTINGEYYFVNGNNLSDGKIEIKPNTKTVSKEEFLKHKRKLSDRTVFVSINGTIGNTAFYNNEKVMLGKSACYFNLLSKIDKEFVRQLIKTQYFRNYAFSSATGTTIKNVSLRTMRNFIVPFPPLSEQQAIVEKVNTLMALCEQLEQQIQSSQSLQEDWMKSSLREVFAGENKAKVER